MRGPLRWLGWLALIGLLSGCGGGEHRRMVMVIERSTGEAPPVPKGMKETATLLGYFRQVLSLPDREKEEEFRRAQQAFSEGNRPENRIKFALLLMLPRTPFQNPGRALELLKADVDDPENPDSALNDFSLLLSSILAEIKERDAHDRELEHNYQALVQRLEEERQRSRDLQQKVEEERKGLNLIEQKLEELKTIEKTLMEEREGRQDR